MYLKSLTMRGFKSFASATRIELEPGITCVVGPNGSGKSNVVDALAWVMGEQGAKNLRGGKMDDVIFAGTSSRQALGRAEVSLTIDNTDGAIPIDYTEVTISRTLFRTGGSEYAVNGAPARLLDIQELLNDSGLGKEMHVIVGQGRLDEILHADPVERRGFIEEAAGVLKHRRRKDKALRKLTGLQTNLDRLADLRAELARQLGPLGRQAKAAKRAAVVQATLRDASARLLADDIVQAQARLASAAGPEQAPVRARELEARIAELDSTVASHEAELKNHEARTETVRTRLRSAGTLAARAGALAQRAADRVGFLRQMPPERTGNDSPETLRERGARFAAELADVRAEVEARQTALAELTEARDSAQQRLQAAETALTELRARISAQLRKRAGLESSREVARKTLTDAEAGLAELDDEESQLDDRLAAARTRLTDAQAAAASTESGESELDAAHEDALARLRELEDRNRSLQSELDTAESELGRARARADALRIGTRLAAETADILDSGISGVREAVGNLLRIAPGYETAVTAVLDHVSEAVLVDSPQTALAVLDHIAEDSLVDLAVAPGSTASPDATGEAPAPPPADHPLPTVEAGEPIPVRRLVRTSDRGLSALLDSALAEVVTAPDAAAAVAALRQDPACTFVTPTGEVISAERIRRTGSTEGARIATRAALEETEEQTAVLGARTRELAAALTELAPDIDTARAAVDRALSALHESDARIMAVGEELSRAAEEVAGLEASRTRIADSRRRLTAEAATARATLANAESALAVNSETIDSEPDSGERDGLAEQVRALGEEVMEARIGLRAVEDRAKFLTDRVASLHRQADAEQQARERAARAAARRAAQADRAAELAAVAASLADHLRSLEVRAEQEIGAARGRRAELESTLEQTRTDRQQRAAELAELTRAEHEAQLLRERHVIQLEELTRRAQAEIGLSAEHLVEQFGPHLPVPAEDGDVPFIRSELEQAKAAAERSLKSIGQVNPLALEEYAALTERHDFLEKQLNDIEDSRRDLLGLVRDVDAHVREAFTAAFADTQREFEVIFARLFPGGEGSLSLTDPEDMLTTGVEVHARPAGKKVKRLSLLSGGERSLVAVALLVAIFKARPSPFYVMDEVEAALDDVNLSRLLTVFRELQEASQLIVITHQKRTMEIADALYGVTMSGDGISKVISQRIHRTD
ncbi:chromosome segregation protein SMC [Brevibacterium daeguense]|uniref:Chromosome partition protein Smc n=1 Tax=Brevibacterium daeguense TaxID=909936 RepID=A0ABP8ELT6_9MICO|nr:chromosome segregation protein SMC [Brevibacterium daeguense]